MGSELKQRLVRLEEMDRAHGAGARIFFMGYALSLAAGVVLGLLERVIFADLLNKVNACNTMALSGEYATSLENLSRFSSVCGEAEAGLGGLQAYEVFVMMVSLAFCVVILVGAHKMAHVDRVLAQQGARELAGATTGAREEFGGGGDGFDEEL
jgi:hypothetical protein